MFGKFDVKPLMRQYRRTWGVRALDNTRKCLLEYSIFVHESVCVELNVLKLEI
jgi:hypothetical protein